MAGGIQLGTVASDAQSIKLDKLLKETAVIVFNDLTNTYPDLRLYHGQSKDTKFQKKFSPGGNTAFCPDAGAWIYNGTLIVAGEGKKQNNRGNAHERWFKNYTVFNNYNRFNKYSLNNFIGKYITFTTGDGFNTDNQPYNDLNMTLVIENKESKSWNMTHKKGASFYYNSNNFNEIDIYNILKNAIIDTINIYIKERKGN